MVIQTNDLSILKKIMIQNQSGSKGIFLTYDDLNDNMKIEFVNHEQNFIGEFSDPAINKSEVLLGTTYNDLTFYFNFNPGSDTVVSSKNEGLLSSTIQGNAIILNYTGNSLSDVITFVLKSNDNTNTRTLKYNLGLTTENAIPIGFSGVFITTRNHDYGIVQFSFNKNIDDDFGDVTVTSSDGSVSNVSVVSNKMSFNYTTPDAEKDILTFTGIKVATIENTGPVNFEVGGLLAETNFTSFAVIPTSQNYYYNLEAEFTKLISTCSSITATSGTPRTITPTIVGGKVKFSWASLYTSTVTFTFNGLTAADGTIDASFNGLEATNVINLFIPPDITGWISEQPLNAYTLYNLSVQFSQTLDDTLTPIITSSEDDVTPEFTSIDDKKVNFRVTTGPNPSSAVYSFRNVKSLLGGITTDKTISVGPYLLKTEVEMDEAGTFTEYDKLVKGRNQKVKLTLSKAIGGTLSLQSNSDCTFGPVTMLNASTAEFQVRPTNPSGVVLEIATNLLIGTDSSQTTSLTKLFYLVESQSVVDLFNSSDKYSEVSNFDVGTPLDLSLQVSKPIDGDLTNTTVVSSNGTHGALTTSEVLGKYYYNFNFTPTTAGTEQWIKIQQAKDFDNFVYNLTKSGLTFKNIILQPVSTTSGTMAISYGSKLNYAYGDNLVTDGSKWTWDFYIKVPTMFNPSYYATGGFFGGISWQVRETQVWIRGGADWAMPPNQNWNFSSPRRLTLTRFNNAISLFIDGSYVYGITDASRVTNLQVTGLNDRETNLSDSRIWGMTLWNLTRTPTQILNNTLEEVSHHWLLNGNLNDSVVPGITLSQNGTVTYATI